jgi:hypothetical protein
MVVRVLRTALSTAETLAEQLSQRVGILDPDLHEVAILAGDVVHSPELREFGDGLPYARRANSLLGSDQDEGCEPEADGVGIQPGFVPGDDTALRASGYDPGWRMGHVQLPGDVRVGDTGVATWSRSRMRISVASSMVLDSHPNPK